MDDSGYFYGQGNIKVLTGTNTDNKEFFWIYIIIVDHCSGYRRAVKYIKGLDRVY